MARAEKVAAVAELTERFQSSSGAVLAEYRGLTVAQLADLRHSLGEQATFSGPRTWKCFPLWFSTCILSVS